MKYIVCIYIFAFFISCSQNSKNDVLTLPIRLKMDSIVLAPSSKEYKGLIWCDEDSHDFVIKNNVMKIRGNLLDSLEYKIKFNIDSNEIFIEHLKGYNIMELALGDTLEFGLDKSPITLGSVVFSIETENLTNVEISYVWWNVLRGDGMYIERIKYIE